MLREIIIKILKTIDDNRKRSLGTFLGLLVATMILVIGFFKTLFIFLCAAIGYFLGGMSWDKAKIKDWLERILPPGGIG